MSLYVKNKSILGVKFSDISNKDLIDLILKNKEEFIYINTPNPEILVAANKSETYKSVINKADIVLIDGIGILWALYIKNRLSNFPIIFKVILGYLSLILIPFKKFNINGIERITGTDTLDNVLKNASQNNKIYLLGARPNIANKLKEKYEKINSNLKIAGTCHYSPSESKLIIDKINKSNANILFVAYGAPKQEIWITENIKYLKNIKIAIGVGGAFDYLSGTTKRAPKLMRKLGLEWMFRLALEPRARLKRIYTATIVFPYKVLSS